MRRTQQYRGAILVVLFLGVGAVLLAGAPATAATSEQLGQVTFAVSCSSEAQAQFHRAMARYHSFDWKRAQREAENLI